MGRVYIIGADDDGPLRAEAARRALSPVTLAAEAVGAVVMAGAAISCSIPGVLIKALRLRFAWSAAHRAWVRVSEEGPHLRVEVVPAMRGLPRAFCAKHDAEREFFLWWEGREGGLFERSLPRCPALDAVAPGPAVVVVDEDGNLVESAA